MRKYISLFSFLVILSALASPTYADGQTLFGPKAFQIGRWHFHLSVHRFSVQDPGEGVIAITKSTLDEKFRGGFVFFNRRLIRIRDFLVGGGLVFEEEIGLRPTNYLTVFLRGAPGASVTIEVRTGGNSAPLANDDIATTQEDQGISIDVLANDTDPDGDSLSVSSFTQPAHGTVSSTGDGPLSYTPEPDFNGPDSFTYTIIDGNGGSDAATVNVTVNPVNDPPVANAQSISTDEDKPVAVTLACSDVDGDTLSYSVTSGPTHGTLSGEPPNLTYTPEAEYSGPDAFTFIVDDRNGGTDTAKVELTINPVNDPPVAKDDMAATQEDTAVDIDVLANDTDVDDGDVLRVESVTPGSSGSVTLNPDNTVEYMPVTDFNGTDSFTYTVSDGEGGADTARVTITVNPVNDAPLADAGNDQTVSVRETVQLDGSRSSDVDEDTLTFWWSFAFVPAGSAAVFSDPAAVNPSFVPAVAGEYVVALIVNDDTVDSDPDYVIITAEPMPSNAEPQPEGSFGEQYEDLIPPDATAESYDPRRFSVITGLVHDLADLPIVDVAVAIHGHSEYGTAFTDAEGRFSIPVEGGGTLTVVYQKEGLIPVHRKVNVDWNDIAIAETIQMIAEDPAVTRVEFDGKSTTVFTHQSTEITDEFGTRSCTTVFTGDNKAYEVDAEGNVVEVLAEITTRTTEFTTPESMPAKLPPNSAYTYCVEQRVDGAERVRFDKPVVTWVENFLGFPVGEAVPVGYYDRDRGVWVPEKNGRVVRLLDTNNDGLVDALDANGNGQPNDLDQDGSFSDEVAGLSDPQRYPPESTFWRVEVTHFSARDFNWPWGFPWDFIFSNAKGKASQDRPQCPGGDCFNHTSSYAYHRSRTFHEDIPIPGTDVTFHYASNRTRGYHHVISVPSSGDEVPASLKRIDVKVEVAGRSLKQSMDPLPNQMAEIIWDGLDYLGRPARAPTTAHVSVGFVYDAVYLGPGSFDPAFGQPGSGSTGIRARPEVIAWKDQDLTINVDKGTGVIAEGWTLSNHHHISPMDVSTLHKGDGSIVEHNASIINTVAGNGDSAYNGDGIPATEATLSTPSGVALDAAGSLYIADTYHHRIRKVDRDGIITTVAGNGVAYFGGDGGPAIDAMMRWPYDVAVDAWGNLYIADKGNHRIRKVDTDGIITTVAGIGIYGSIGGGYSGDGGPATQAELNSPWGVAVDPSGNIYIADSWNNVIRKVDTDGIITTVAGIGSDGYSGDGGPAIQARLYAPMDVTVDALGNLYISDSANHCIRKVDTSGIITTVAGVGGRYSDGYTGDGGPATEAKLDDPKGIAVDTSGNLYITDAGNNVIRKVDTSGIITTTAGDGSGEYGGDGGPAAAAQLRVPADVAVDPLGHLYIADDFNRRIRKIGPPSAFAEYLTAGDIAFTEETGLGHILSSAGRHKTTMDMDTGVVFYSFNYNESNRLVSITDRFDNEITIQRDAGGVPTAIVSPDGMVTSLDVDPQTNHLTHITYPDDSVYQFDYTPEGLMTAKTEPEGNRFDYVFDSTGRLTDVIDQEEGHWQYSRIVDTNGDIFAEVLTGEGNLTSYFDHTDSTGAYTSYITDPTGAETVYKLSSDEMTAHKSLPCGMDLLFNYGVDPEYRFEYVKEMRQSTPAGLEKITLREKTYEDTNADGVPDRITEKVTVNGKLTKLETDALQAKKTLTTPRGRTIAALYDPDTFLTTSLTIPGLHETTFGYDPRGRLTSINTNNRQTFFAYDAQGNLQSITDPEEHTTTYDHDPAGRLIAIHRPDNTSVWFTFDQNGNVTVLTNPAEIDHTFGYDRINLNSSYETPLSGAYTYVYDRDRRLKEINFPSEKQISLIYENPGDVYDKSRLVQIQTPEGNVDLSYLCGSKVGSITKGAEGISYGYDGPLITSETISGTLNQSLVYTYNSRFDVNSLTYAGYTVNYGYDPDGLMNGAGGFTIARNVGNGLPQRVFGGALDLSRTFNGYGELEREDFVVNGQSLTSWDVTRDNAGRITLKTETVDGTVSTYSYTYDPMGRLLIVTKDGLLVEEYQYGLNGNRVYERNELREISGRSFTYSDEDHLLTAGDTQYQYDLDGFLASRTVGTDVTTYDYSSRGELLSVTLLDGRLIEYIHDPLGRRIAKVVNGAITEKYLWQGLTRLLAVYDGNDNLLMRFEYTEGRMPVAMDKGGTTYYLAYDQVGSLRAVADAAGNVTKRIDYDSFGNIIVDTSPLFEIPFGFAGGLHDRDTGLVRFGLRDYDPDIGRWTARDPILFNSGDIDLYGYCLNDPVNLVDPDGRFVIAIPAIAALTKAAIVTVGAAALAAAVVIGKEVGDFLGDLMFGESEEPTACPSPIFRGGEPEIKPAPPWDLGPLKGAPSLPYPGANMGSPDPNLPPPPKPPKKPEKWWEKIWFFLKEGAKRLPWVMNPPH